MAADLWSGNRVGRHRGDHSNIKWGNMTHILSGSKVGVMLHVTRFIEWKLYCFSIGMYFLEARLSTVLRDCK